MSMLRVKKLRERLEQLHVVDRETEEDLAVIERELALDPLEQMFARQNELEVRLFDVNWTPPNLNDPANWMPEADKNNGRHLKPDVLAFMEWQAELTEKFLLHEGVEFGDWFPWKHWSQRMGNKNQDVVYGSEEWVREVHMELIDLWHGLMWACLAMGLTRDKFVALYYEKNKINHERQDSGSY